MRESAKGRNRMRQYRLRAFSAFVSNFARTTMMRVKLPKEKTIARCCHAQTDQVELSPNEKIEQPCAWIAEVYFPSDQPALFEMLNILGAESRFAEKEGIVSRVEKSQICSPVSHHELGYSYGSREQLPGLHSLQMKIPDIADRVSFSLHTLGESLVVLVACFSLKEERRSLQSAITARYKIDAKHTPRGLSIFTPEMQRNRSIKREKDSLQAELGEWVSKLAPGFFSRNKESLPMCEVITAEFLDFTQERRFGHFSRDLFAAQPWDSYTSVRMPGAILGISEEDTYKLTICANRPKLTNALEKTAGSSMDFSTWMDLELSELIAGFTVVSACKALISRVNFTRKVTFNAGGHRFSDLLRQIERINEELISLEGVSCQGIEWLLGSSALSFTCADEHAAYAKLSDRILEAFEHRKEEATRQMRSLGDSMSVIANLRSARESSRLNKLVLLLSLVCAADAVIQIAQAIMS